jgi:hypothetical protein
MTQSQNEESPIAQPPEASPYARLRAGDCRAAIAAELLGNYVAAVREGSLLFLGGAGIGRGQAMREGQSRRARSAIGVASLPGNVRVEIEAVVAICPAPDAPFSEYRSFCRRAEFHGAASEIGAAFDEAVDLAK